MRSGDSFLFILRSFLVIVEKGEPDDIIMRQFSHNCEMVFLEL